MLRRIFAALILLAIIGMVLAPQGERLFSSLTNDAITYETGTVAAVGAQLLVTHHPLIFFPAKSVTNRDPVGRTILYLVEHNICAVNMHTNLDSAPGGVNDRLAELLGLTDVGVLVPAGVDSQGREYGLGRYGRVESCSLQTFLQIDFFCESIRQRLRLESSLRNALEVLE